MVLVMKAVLEIWTTTSVVSVETLARLASVETVAILASVETMAILASVETLVNAVVDINTLGVKLPVAVGVARVLLWLIAVFIVEIVGDIILMVEGGLTAEGL